LGCLTIAVLSGGGREADLKEADIIVDSIAELRYFF
jgi:phosphoglycolate phosphatase-like HAD superfamily hydrolase